MVAAYVLVSEKIFKKKVSGEITFDLISLFHVQIQEPTRSSTATSAFVFPAKFAEFLSSQNILNKKSMRT